MRTHITKVERVANYAVILYFEISSNKRSALFALGNWQILK